jgi:hypothetical protein
MPIKAMPITYSKSPNPNEVDLESEEEPQNHHDNFASPATDPFRPPP